MMMSNADRWILMQAHAEMMSKSTSAEAMTNTPATEANSPKSTVGERHREEVQILTVLSIFSLRKMEFLNKFGI